MNKDEIYKAVVEKICAVMPVERIYLLGERMATFSTTSVFLDNPAVMVKPDHFYLLVVAAGENPDRRHQVEERIEALCSCIIRVTVIVLGEKQFREWIAAGNWFSTVVYERAKLLFEETRDEELDFRKGVGFTAEEIETIRMQGLNKVVEFMAGAELYRIRKQNRMTAFMLHQAVEHGLHALLLKSTGLRVQTHNIEKLLRYCGMSGIGLCFAESVCNANHVIQLLQKAYIEARYKDEYKVGCKELDVFCNIAEKVRSEFN